MSRRTSVSWVLGLLLFGCEPRLSAVTAPPPGREATLDDARGRILLSRGVALALECTEHSGGPCRDVIPSTSDETVVEIHSAALHELEPDFVRGARPRAVLVVIGRSAGEGELHIDTHDGDRRLNVQILE